MKVYLVGGAVRDQLMGITPKDYDYVVTGATPAMMLAAGFTQVGKDFPVFLHPHTQEEYALARTERKVAAGYRGFVVDAHDTTTLEEDLARRDFTINAIARGDDGELVDPFNGVSDARSGVLRHVSDSFVEDPVRVLRCARFMARYAGRFRVAGQTMGLMRRMAASGELDALTPERVWKELHAALLSPTPSLFLSTLRKCGALVRVMPELDRHYSADMLRRVNVKFEATADSIMAFAAMCHGVPDSAELCKRLKVPSEYSDLTAMVKREYAVVSDIHSATPEAVADMLKRVTGWKEAHRLNLLLDCVVVIDETYGMGATHLECFRAGRDVKAADFPGVEGAALGQALHAARVQKIAEVLHG